MNFGSILTKVFGSRNDRLLKRYRRIVEQINAMSSKVETMTDPELRERTQELRRGLVAGTLKSADVMPEAFAIIRESMDRSIGIRNIFNPDDAELGMNTKFDPDKFDDATLELYDGVQRKMISTGEPWQTVAIPVELYAAVRKLYPDSRPPFRARPFDVQLMGGLVLYEGRIAEMATGEGKTFVAPLACFMRVLEGFHCHVVTVNDYLVRRDASWVKPSYEALGLTVGYIQSDMEPGGGSRRNMYQCDVTYGTNSEFGFDYLRDNMKVKVEEQVQGPLDFAIVDEVDSILIDEARTPLIISGAAHDDAPKYRASDAVIRKVIDLHRPYAQADKAVDVAKRAIKSAEGDEEKAKDKTVKEAARKRVLDAAKQLEDADTRKAGLTAYYEVELDKKSAHLTHEGIAAAQEEAGVGSFYVGANMELPHLMEQSLRAHVVYERDRDYVIERGQRNEMEVVIVDEYTGRKMVGRQWSDGLHQAVEAKERVPIKQETQTLATITLQNFFKLYRSLSGMTGTAQTEAEEFAKIYRLEVVTIPTNRPRIRADYEDRVYRTEPEKWTQIIDEIKQFSDIGRPVLVGTTSVEKSEFISNLLTKKHGVLHEILNAKQHEREAHIVALAGQTHVNAHGERAGNVTIATNMAGRGTDIKLAAETQCDVVVSSTGVKGKYKYTLTQRGTGKVIEIEPDSPLVETFDLKPTSKTAGGLHVIGTERHTARRIDNQLRGRGGRQGDPGSSRFYVSLQDDLMKMFAGDWTIRVLGWLGMEEGMAIEDKRITTGIVRAQKKVEERNFLARKNLLDYDEVMDHQRTIFYGMRQRVLEGRDVGGVIWGMIGDAINDAVDKYITQDYVAATVVEWARTNFELALEPGDVKGMTSMRDLENYIRGQARNDAQSTIASTLSEFIGEDATDQTGWDLKGLQAWAASRFQVNLSMAQLKQMDSNDLQDRLLESAVEQIDARDCTPLSKYIEPNYAEQELANWARDKFGIEVTPEEMYVVKGTRAQDRKSSEEIVQLIESRAKATYARREIEYPVEHTLTYAFGGPDGTTENPYASQFVQAWVKGKYDLDLALQQIQTTSVRKLRDDLVAMQEEFMTGGKIAATVDALLSAHANDMKALVESANRRFGTNLTEKELTDPTAGDRSGKPVKGAIQPTKDVDKDGKVDVRDVLMQRGRQWLRKELADLEQYVLIQIFDQSWKDHLYAMDMLKAGIGLHAFAEKDPRVLYKKEGFRYFEEMMRGTRDKVTDLIFRARVVGQAQAKSAYKETAAVHAESGGYGVGENVRATSAAVNLVPAAVEAETSSAPVAVKTIVREAPKVGRNDVCPCGSGKKYKKCCGVNEV